MTIPKLTNTLWTRNFSVGWTSRTRLQPQLCSQFTAKVCCVRAMVIQMLLERIWVKKMCGISKIVAIMKKIMKPFVLVAAAAMALASCQKNEIPAPEKQDVHFTINAGIKTRTSIVESADKDENDKPIYHAQWDGNEELGVLFAKPNEETKASNVVRLTNAVFGPTASFQGNVTLDETSTSTFYAFYPAAVFNRGYEEGDARLDLKNVQKPTATSFDPLCDILVAKPYDYEVVDGKVVADGLEFARLMSVLRIDLKSEFADIQNEFVESVSFTAGDVKITGYARIFLDNPEFTGNWASSGAQWCTVTANYDSDLVSINGTSNSVYLVIAPVTIPADKDLTFEIKTKNYNISKTIKSPEMKFTAGKVSKINLTIAADNCDKIDTSIDYSGEYLIVSTDLTKAASKWANGNNLPAVALNAVDGVVYESDNLDDCKMTITKVTEGDNAGKYTIVDAADKYLYAAGGSGSDPDNHLKGSDDVSYWNIEADGSKFVMTSLSGATRNILRYNGTNNPPIFSCYGSGQSDVTLYKYSDIKPDTTPKLELGEEPIKLTAEGGEGTIAVTAKNLPAEIQVRALEAKDSQDEVDWLIVEYADGKITYTAEANESEKARTAYIEAYVSDDLKDGIAVTQAAKPSADAPVEVTDVLTLSALNLSYNSYTNWSGKTFTSDAVYAGNSFNSNNSIQLRNTSPSGIVTTQSGGKLKKIIVEWHSSTNTKRYITIYGKNSSYSSSSDLYDTDKRGQSLGQIKYGETELVISGDFTHFGILASGALYLPKIQVVWESTTSEGGETPEPDEPETPVEPTLSPRNLAFSATTATATMGQAFAAPTLDGEKTGVKYSSSNTNVATVNETTGAVTLVAAGTTTITASAPATDEYEAGTASYTLTVSAASLVKGATYTYEITNSSSQANSWNKLMGGTLNSAITIPGFTDRNVTMGNLSWNISASGASNIHFGGQQIGSSNNYISSFELETDSYDGAVESITLTTCSNAGNTTIEVYVGNTQLGSKVTLANSSAASAVTFKGTSLLQGNICIKYTIPTTKKNIKITKIQIN